MRRCYEAGIDPKSPAAPKSMEEAIHKFFHPANQTWYLSPTRQKQAEEIQILADGPRMNTSLLIYDNGEGGLPNPTWEEWLMGWPTMWTELQPLGTDKFRLWSAKHGKP